MKLELLPHSAPVNFDGWSLGFDDPDFDAAVLKDLAGIISSAMKDDKNVVDAYLPFTFAPDYGDGIGGEVTSDPLLIYFQFKLFNDDPGLVWKGSLRELVKDAILDVDDRPERELEKSVALRDELRKLADEIDAAVEPAVE